VKIDVLIARPDCPLRVPSLDGTRAGAAHALIAAADHPGLVINSGPGGVELCRGGRSWHVPWSSVAQALFAVVDETTRAGRR
jgi:hypothetical protein